MHQISSMLHSIDPLSFNYILEFISMVSLCICLLLFDQGCSCCEGHPPKLQPELAGMSVHEGRQEQRGVWVRRNRSSAKKTWDQCSQIMSLASRRLIGCQCNVVRLYHRNRVQAELPTIMTLWWILWLCDELSYMHFCEFVWYVN
jgi:hypothetical protein